MIRHKPVVPVAAFGLTAPGSLFGEHEARAIFRLVDHQVHHFVSFANPAFELFAVLPEINRLPRHPRSRRSAPRWPR